MSSLNDTQPRYLSRYWLLFMRLDTLAVATTFSTYCSARSRYRVEPVARNIAVFASTRYEML